MTVVILTGTWSHPICVFSRPRNVFYPVTRMVILSGCLHRRANTGRPRVSCWSGKRMPHVCMLIILASEVIMSTMNIGNRKWTSTIRLPLNPMRM